MHSISIAYEHVDFRILSLDHKLKLRRTLGQVEQGFCWTIAAFGFSLDSPRQVADLDPEVEVSYLDPPVLETYTEEPQEVRMRLLRLFVSGLYGICVMLWVVMPLLKSILLAVKYASFQDNDKMIRPR